METRVAVLALIVQEGSSVQALNELLHPFRYIIVHSRDCKFI